MSGNVLDSPLKSPNADLTPHYYSIVFQITPRRIKAGVSGDSLPLFISQANNKRWNRYIDTSLSFENSANDQFIDHTSKLRLLSTQEAVHHIYLKDLSSHQWLYNHDTLLNEDDKIIQILERSFHEIFNTVLLLSPKNCRVIIPEPIWFPIPMKRHLSTLLFRGFQTQSIIFIPEPLLSCISAGVDTALVIDVNWENTTVVPVYQHYILHQEAKTTKRGGKWLHYKVLESLIDAIGVEKLPFKEDNHNLFEFVESLIRMSYLRSDKQEQDTSSFKVFDDIEVPNALRFESTESMLFSEADDIDEKSVLDLILDDLRLPLDCKSEILNNIIITGDLAKIPGLKSNIINELRRRSPQFDFNPIKNLGPWVGASIYCSTTLMSNSNFAKFGELKRDKFLNGDQPLQDWVAELHKLS